MLLKALIFGAGVVGKELLPLAQKEYDVLAFIDNDENKWGSKHEGLPIYAPDQILDMDYDAIIVATYEDAVVTKQLLSMGVKHGNIVNAQSLIKKSMTKRIAHGRNFMSADIFKHLVIRASFEVVSQQVFSWGDKDLDVCPCA